MNEDLYLTDLIIHKKFFLDSAHKMSLFLISINKKELALTLLKRAFVHDMSKISLNELDSSHVFDNIKSKSMTNQDVSFSKEHLVYLEKHWNNNKHHPEYWHNVSDMLEIDIIEMVCDWHSRSVQFETNFLEFLEYRQLNRFKFPSDLYEKILHYAKVLLSDV